MSADAIGYTSAGSVWVLEPRAMGLGARAREVWRSRRLLAYFAARALERIYRRTVLGWLWLVIRPLVPVLISSLIFGGLLKVPSDNIPYFLFFLTGIASWNLFESGLLWATRSLEINRRLITKLYFPRLILPVATTAPAIVEFAIYIGLVMASTAYYVLTGHRVYLAVGLPLLLALLSAIVTVAFAVGLGLWTSVLQAQARDVRFTLRYVMRFWFYLTPVIYPLSFIPERWAWLILLNPMAALVETFKWGLLGIGRLPAESLGIAILIVAITLVSGLWFFSRVEAAAVDRL